MPQLTTPTTVGAPFVRVIAPPLSPWQVERWGCAAQMTLAWIFCGPYPGSCWQRRGFHHAQVHFHQDCARCVAFDSLGLAPAGARHFRTGGYRPFVERDRAHARGVARRLAQVLDDVDERDVVRVHVGRRRELLRAVLRMPHDPVDLVGPAIVLRDVLRAEAHAIACLDHVLVDAVRRREHPVRRNQRAAAVVLQLPQRRALRELRGPLGCGVRVVHLRLPGRARIAHRLAARRVGHVVVGARWRGLARDAAQRRHALAHAESVAHGDRRVFDAVAVVGE